MPEGGRYEKIPRPESIEYFINAISGHSKVQEVNQIDTQLFEVIKKNGKRLLVHLTNYYIVTAAEVIEILSQSPDIDAIVTISQWNQWSESGREQAISQGVGLFIMRQFMGALNFDGQRFYQFLTADQREKYKY
ncbi:hypothetical protein [Ornithinibacillus xuwenensis]|uniref:Uncharacterized protein n=1 Tax=Ornithinibacillus xuwenensis TaxID=3144668 RepID=A0ABU9XEY9_9BACI